jgi:hypothetical protein
MASSSTPDGAAIDDGDVETNRGDDLSDHGHDGDHEHADEHEHAATQQVNEDLPEEAQCIMLHRLRGPGKELSAQDIKVPYTINENGSSTTTTIGRGADLKIIDEKRAPEKQLISRLHAKFVGKQSGMYVSNLGATGTLVNDRLLDTNQEVMIRHGTTLTFGRDNTRPGQMQPYDGMKFRVSFPEGPDSIGVGRRHKKQSASTEISNYNHISDEHARSLATDVSAVTQRLLGALQRSETIDHVRAAMGTAMNQLTGLANDAAKQHKKQRREQGSYQAKGRAAGAATAAAQQQRGARANERRGKNFQSKRRPHGHVQNTAHKRDTHSKLSGISKGKRKGKGGGRKG